MPALAETVAALVAKSRAASAPGSTAPASLIEDAAFGDNPGALRMFSHAPPGLSPGSPLVVVLHGCGQSAEAYARGAGWLTLADRHGFALLCPEQTRANNPNLCFNWFNTQDVSRGSGEVASIAAMVAHAIDRFGADPGRVFVTGLSAGGAMTAALLATYPELFDAGAIVAGLPHGAAAGVGEALSAMRSLPALPDGAWGDRVRGRAPPPRRWPRVAVWHGDADATVTPGAADALLRQWTEVHGVDASEARRTASAGHRHHIWRGAGGDIVVESHRIAGLGHGAPIAAGGAEGCGTAGPWILEAGLSSTLEIARAWGIAEHPAAVAEPGRAGGESRAPRRRSVAFAEAGAAAPAGRIDVSAVIHKALKAAGLLR